MNKIISFSKKLQDKNVLTLWLNNLFVVYAFLLPISQTIKATVFTSMVVLFIIRGDIVKHIKFALSNQVVRAFFYFFLVYVIGLLWSDNTSEGLHWVKSVKYGLYLMLFYAIVDGRYINKVISAFILGMLVSEFVSYSMMLGLMPWKLELEGILFYQSYAIGDPSPFLHHIHYGVALAFTVILLIRKTFFEENSILLKVFMSIFIMTATMNIFITGGRTGYITFLFLTIILAITYLKKYAIFVFLAAGLTFTLAYSFSPIFNAKIHQTESSIVKLLNKDANFSTSLGQRAGVYYYDYKIIKDNVLFGVGTGDSIDEFHKILPQKWVSLKQMSHEHNQFLSVLVKLGIVGLMIYLNIFYQVFKYKQDEKDLRFIQVFVTLTILFGTLMTQFNLRFFLPFWIVFLAITLINRERRTVENIELNDKKQFLQIIMLIALFGTASLLYQLI
jgi:O-antigen ligase